MLIAPQIQSSRRKLSYSGFHFLDVTDLTDPSACGDIRGLCPVVDKDADKPPVDPITIVGFNTATHKLPWQSFSQDLRCYIWCMAVDISLLLERA